MTHAVEAWLERTTGLPVSRLLGPCHTLHAMPPSYLHAPATVAVVAFLFIGWAGGANASRTATSPPPRVIGLIVREATQRLNAAGWRERRREDSVSTPGTYAFDNSRRTDWHVCDALLITRRGPFFLQTAPACVTRIPSLIGMHRPAVERALAPLGLDWFVHDVEGRRVGLDFFPELVVCKQKPPPGSRVSVRQIDFFVLVSLAWRGHCP